MDANTAIAVCATVIAVASLAVTIYQARATMLHNRHMLRPLLQLQIVLKPGERSGFRLTNKGLGPAIITSTRAWLDDLLVGPWQRSTAVRVRNNMNPLPRVATFQETFALEAGYEAFLVWTDDYNYETHAQLRRLVESRLDLEIRYESLYGGEDFVLTTRSQAWREAARLVVIGPDLPLPLPDAPDHLADAEEPGHP